MKVHYKLYFILFVLSLIRALTSFQMGLGVDEAHYVLYGLNLDWSYFDHPPLVGWVHFLFQNLRSLLQFNSMEMKEFFARLPALLISVLFSIQMYWFLIRKGFSERQSFWGVISLQTTLIFNLMALMLLPDNLLLPLFMILFEWVDRLEKADLSSSGVGFESAPSPSRLVLWVLLGFTLGLTGLAKYTALIFAIALFVYLLFSSPIRAQLKKSFEWFYAPVTALLTIGPWLYWNFKNDFISFKYQGEHVFHFKDLSLNHFFQNFVGQFFLWGLGLFILSGFIFIRKLFVDQNKFGSRGSVGYQGRFSLIDWYGLLFLLLFFIFSWTQFLLPHWLFACFSILIPYSVATYLRAQEKEQQDLKVPSDSLVNTLKDHNLKDLTVKGLTLNDHTHKDHNHKEYTQLENSIVTKASDKNSQTLSLFNHSGKLSLKFHLSFKSVLLFSALISSLFTLILFGELKFHYLPESLRPGIYKQLSQYQTLVSAADQLYHQSQVDPNQANPIQGIAVVNWSLGSRSLFYSDLPKDKIFVLDDKFNQFDLWNSVSPLGMNFILMVEDEKIDETFKRIKCKESVVIHHQDTRVLNTIVNQMTYFKCLHLEAYL